MWVNAHYIVFMDSCMQVTKIDTLFQGKCWFLNEIIISEVFQGSAVKKLMIFSIRNVHEWRSRF